MSEKSEKKNWKLDATDHKILRFLQLDAKITNTQLAKEIDLSPAPTLERVRRLELNGFIESYHAVLNAEKIGLGVTTFVQVSLQSHKRAVVDSFISQIAEIENIVECHHLTGQADFLLKILAKDITSYQVLMLNVSEIDEIKTMQSMVVLATFKNSMLLPMPEVINVEETVQL